MLYLITDRLTLPTSQWSEQVRLIELAASCGVPLIQIREKDLPARELANFAQAAIKVARPHGAKILVNDRVDVALAVGADGVHLRVNSLSAEVVRTITPPDFLVGVSAHSLAEAQAADAAGANLITCGPVFDTPSKRAYGEPLGLVAIRAIAEKVSLPVYALGGINQKNLLEPLHYGAAGIAAISLFQKADSIPAIVRAVRKELSD